MCLVYSFNPTLLESFKTELMQQKVLGIFHDVVWEIHQMEWINEDFHCITTIFDIKVDSLITWCHLKAWSLENKSFLLTWENQKSEVFHGFWKSDFQIPSEWIVV